MCVCARARTHTCSRYLKALGSSHPQDEGQAAVEALTKCDECSWCHEIRYHDATMTQESPYNNVGGTMSHGWGAAAVAATLDTVVGLKQTAPAFASFEVRPRLGGITSVNVRDAAYRFHPLFAFALRVE